MKNIHFVLVVAAMMLAACNSNKVPKDAKVVAPSTVNESVGGNFTLANFSLNIPEEWTEGTPANNMRVTQFQLKNHPEYEVVVSYFGNNDNMVKANIERWREQFAEETSYSELELSNKKLTGVKILGIFKLKAFPMAQDFTEAPDYGTLAAIVPSSEGPYFLKLSAPAEVIEAETARFIGVLNSYQAR